MDWAQQIHFQDARPPHELKLDFEKDLGALFRAEWAEGRLVFRGSMKPVELPYSFELHFHAALPGTNCYELQVAATLPAGQRDYYLMSSESWFKHWIRNFTRSLAPASEEGNKERYRALAEQAVSADAALPDVAAVQQAILAGMRKGATFSTAHKEGGTNIGLKSKAHGS